jgi:hypothetical protein
VKLAYLERRLREQDAVVRDDADLLPVHAAEASDDGGAVVLLELVEETSINQASNDLYEI